VSGRRAALKVAAKNARRNRKRTFYLVALIGLPVLVAVMTAAVIRAGYISPAERATSDYGSANVKIEQWFAAPEAAEWARGVVEEIDPDAAVLTYRSDFKSLGPGLGGRVTDIDLEDPLSEGILALTHGRPPAAVGEVVLSEYLASELSLAMSDRAVLRLRGRGEATYEVVGLASHPILWRLNEAVVAPEEMDLINNNGQAGEVLLVDTEEDFEFGLELNRRWEQVRYDFYPQTVEWPMPEELQFIPEDYYAAMTEEELAETRTIIEEQGLQPASDYAYGLFPNGVSVGLPQVYAETLTDRLTWDQANLANSPPVIGTAVAAVILAEVAFIAGAAFATGTRRRLREIGLLGANGADTGQLKASVVGEGLVAGLGGGLLGSAVGVGLLIAGRPLLQRFVDRRIEEFPLSAVDLAGPILVAVTACVIAAWLPAKTASNVPTLTALQGRMPVSKPKRWVIPVGLSVTGFGTLLLAVGLATASGSGGAVALIGAVLMIGGAALLAGPLVAWVSKHAERFPITSRIVLRDSGRQRGRAAAAVAATMVILMAPVAGLAALAANEASSRIYGLPEQDPQVLIEGRFDEEYNVGVAPLTEHDLSELAVRLPGARIARFEALDARLEYPAELEARKSGNNEDQGGYDISPFRVGVASEGLLALLDDERLGARLADEGMVLIGVAERDTTITVNDNEIVVSEVPVPVQLYSFPRLLVTPEVAVELGGESRTTALIEVDVGWLQNPFASPFDPLWQSGADEFVVSGGGSDNGTPATLALGFLATMLVVLIVVATITALSAAEADNDLTTVVAVGATNSIRRRYLGLQSGLHTLIGALLAVPLTLLLYKTVVTASGSYQSVGNFDVWESSTLYVPWGGLALLVIGLPLVIGLITAFSVRSARTTPPRRAT
jgi:hypothetical protein